MFGIKPCCFHLWRKIASEVYLTPTTQKHVQKKEALCFHLLTTKSSWWVVPDSSCKQLEAWLLNKVTERQTLHSTFFHLYFNLKKEHVANSGNINTGGTSLCLNRWAAGVAHPACHHTSFLFECWSHASGFNYGQDSCVYCVSAQFLHLLMFYFL